MNRARRHARRVLAELRKSQEREAAVRDVVDDARVASALQLAKRRAAPLHFAGPQPKSQELFAVVARRAPCLLTAECVPALRLVATLGHVRPIGAWEPRKKGRASRFQSMCEHLFATCPAPPVVWSGFFDADREALAPLVLWVASGGSLFEYTKTRFPVPMTRKTCHRALAGHGGSLLAAIRAAQVVALGGGEALAAAWAKTAQASRLSSRARETFFVEVLQWLVAREHAIEDVPVVLDYVTARHDEDRHFAMKGRTVASLLRDARAWHEELGRLRKVRHATFPASGFAPIQLVEREPRRVVWRVEEIRSTTELFDEGRRMGHCVYSYGGQVQSGGTSIWAMTKEDGLGPTGRWAMLTIELRNATRAIVQARGRFNRAPTREERRVLVRWASMNGLQVAV